MPPISLNLCQKLYIKSPFIINNVPEWYCIFAESNKWSLKLAVSIMKYYL
jgi:hypothetical protein